MRSQKIKQISYLLLLKSNFLMAKFLLIIHMYLLITLKFSFLPTLNFFFPKSGEV